MNERILKLADQARLAANAEYEKWTPTEDFSGVPHVRNIFMEKFAELVVQECINILPEKVKIDDLHDGKILVQCGMAIKQHFGVEE